MGDIASPAPAKYLRQSVSPTAIHIAYKTQVSEPLPTVGRDTYDDSFASFSRSCLRSPRSALE